jgi:hypothetical protein
MDHTDKDRYYDHLPIWTGGNAYFNGAQPCNKEQNCYVDKEHTVSFSLSEEGVFTTDLFQYLPKMDNQTVSTELLGRAFEPEQLFEQPDGSPIVFGKDYFGTHRSLKPLSGPFAQGGDSFALA